MISINDGTPGVCGYHRGRRKLIRPLSTLIRNGFIVGILRYVSTILLDAHILSD